MGHAHRCPWRPTAHALRRLLEEHANRRQVHRRRHDVLVICALAIRPSRQTTPLDERPADALRGAAFDLALARTRQGSPPDFLKRNEVVELDLAGGQVDRDLGDVDRQP